MDLQTYINERNITKYHLSQISGVPKTTVIDICSGKSSLHKCSAQTVQQLSKALGCTMEDLLVMEKSETANDRRNGLPADTRYMERGLPPYLEQAIQQMSESWAMKDRGEIDYHWDMKWNDLNADINSAETEQEISSDQAWYLRKKYLKLSRGD